ncbi:MAG: type II toxin-antitoxin system PemK/MazF family toxin [Candidatus Baltobacteraceae bacterium]
MGVYCARWFAKIAGVRRGEVWRVAFDPVAGSEQAKTRPAVIVQRDSANAASPTTIVCPLVDANGQHGNLLNAGVRRGAGGARKDSLVVCNQVRTVDRIRLRGDALGTLPAETMQLVDDGLRAILDL